MKTRQIICFLITTMFICGFVDAKPRGERIEAPVKGILLAGVKKGNGITDGVVFLTDDGVLYASDTAIISDDGKSITFHGNPLIVRSGSRTFPTDKEQWFRIASDNKFETSKGEWRVEGSTK